MASMIFSKKDKITFGKDSKDYKEPVYVNTQIKSATVCSASENKDDYEVFSAVNKTSINEETSERRTQGLWAQLKDKTVQILFVVQALSIIALIAMGVTLTYTGNDPVDGRWTLWTEWSQCSSKCGIGQERRERICSNPEPNFGGKYCEGEPSSYRMCSAYNCTVIDSRWTLWAEWSICSSTCGIGLQRRDRTCFNTEPNFGGNYCEGEPSSYRICSVSDCTALDGRWSLWQEWSKCSSTCGIGQQRRERTCSYPAPKFGGKYCEGETSSYRICSASNCADLNGKWDTWTEWGQCSSICGVGQQHRNRMCSNPEPKFGGKHCEGEPSEYRLCGARNCTGTAGIPAIAFNAREAADLSPGKNQAIVFKTVIMNYGNAYNESDGTFYAPVDGIYHFNAHLCVVSGGKDLDYSIVVDSTPISSGEYRAPSDADDGKCIGFGAAAMVRKLQKVTVHGHASTNKSLYQNDNDWNSFSGILINTN